MSKNAPRLDNERVATILVEALYYGDIRTAQRWGIHKRTVHNYRLRLKENSNGLVSIFNHKKQLFESEWASDIPATIRTAMRYIQRATNELDVTPEGLHAVAGALKIVAEVGITKEMIDVRLQDFRYNRQAESEVRQVDATRLLEG
ncbi:MAG: hypothetical protein ACXAEN_23575 [Candidatus Thorarchaeota archaeon]